MLRKSLRVSTGAKQQQYRAYNRYVTAFTILICIVFAQKARTQSVTAREGTISIPTYRLGEPDPNPPFGLVQPHPIYPYPMLDDLNDQRGMKTYQAIYLENQYLKITILPELGGHVYSIYDKLNQREVLYRNHVIKYGLVGPRGAWIGGGMEFSFPFAHTTDTVSKVESTVHKNADGSATAVVGAIDWVSNMYWEISITLRPNTSRFEEGVTLFNTTPLSNLYLFWTNTAVPATGDMQYIYPMRETISDDPFAIVQNWPVWKGVDQSWYKNDPSPLAIFARDVQRNFFGVYYHNSDYGVVHVADYRQDPGKKVWTWGTAPSGKIWDHILSDEDGPYNEIQSGRFATQGYREFMNPQRVEQWKEYWYPVAALDGGFVEATSQMAVNVVFAEKTSPKPCQVKILLSPVAELPHARVNVALGSTQLRQFHDVHLTPMHPVAFTVPVDEMEQARKTLRIDVRSAQGTSLLHWSAAEPIDGNPDFTSSAGKPLQNRLLPTGQTPLEELYLNGVFLEKKGDQQGALKTYAQVLQRDPGFVPALLQQAMYAYKAADFSHADQLIQQAEKRDPGNPAVAYTAGLTARAEGKFSIANTAFWSAIHYGAASAPGFSLCAAYLELGEIAIRQAKYADAVDLFQHALSANGDDALARTDLALAERLKGAPGDASLLLDKVLQQMPLLPYALAEQIQLKAGREAIPSKVASQRFARSMDADPQNYIATAAWYHSMGAWSSSAAILDTAIKNQGTQEVSPIAYYYLASNSRQQGEAQKASHYASKAASMPIEAVFPNRLEDVSVLTEAIENNAADPNAKYALGNFLFAHGRYDEGAALWTAANAQGFKNPVLLRNLGVYEWQVRKDLSSAAQNYEQAITLNPADYRLYVDLDEIYEESADNTTRAELFHRAPPEVLERDTIRARHALFLIEQSKPDEALYLLSSHVFKPWEGGVVIHNMFVVANMEKGKNALAARQPAQAAAAFRQAMLYPENMGTGQPAQPELAEQLYWLGIALEAQGKDAEASQAWQTAAKEDHGSYSALALRKLGNVAAAQQILLHEAKSAQAPDAVASDFFAAGLAEHYLGNSQRAHEAFSHALELDPLFWQVRITRQKMDAAKPQH